jgi:hypothetical protein
LGAAIAGAEGDHTADFFDQAGKHGSRKSKTHQDTWEFAGQLKCWEPPRCAVAARGF